METEIRTASVSIISGKWYLMIRFADGGKVELDASTENSVRHELKKHGANNIISLNWEVPVGDGGYSDHCLARFGGLKHEWSVEGKDGGVEYTHEDIVNDVISCGQDEMLALYHSLRDDSV